METMGIGVALTIFYSSQGSFAPVSKWVGSGIGKEKVVVVALPSTCPLSKLLILVVWVGTGPHTWSISWIVEFPQLGVQVWSLRQVHDYTITYHFRLDFDWVDALELKAGSWRWPDLATEDPLFESYLLSSADYVSGLLINTTFPFSKSGKRMGNVSSRRSGGPDAALADDDTPTTSKPRAINRINVRLTENPFTVRTLNCLRIRFVCAVPCPRLDGLGVLRSRIYSFHPLG
jgi:hypothetical protein